MDTDNKAKADNKKDLVKTLFELATRLKDIRMHVDSCNSRDNRMGVLSLIKSEGVSKDGDDNGNNVPATHPARSRLRHRETPLYSGEAHDRNEPAKKKTKRSPSPASSKTIVRVSPIPHQKNPVSRPKTSKQAQDAHRARPWELRSPKPQPELQHPRPQRPITLRNEILGFFDGIDSCLSGLTVSQQTQRTEHAPVALGSSAQQGHVEIQDTTHNTRPDNMNPTEQDRQEITRFTAGFTNLPEPLQKHSLIVEGWFRPFPDMPRSGVIRVGLDIRFYARISPTIGTIKFHIRDWLPRSVTAIHDLSITNTPGDDGDIETDEDGEDTNEDGEDTDDELNVDAIALVTQDALNDLERVVADTARNAMENPAVHFHQVLAAEYRHYPQAKLLQPKPFPSTIVPGPFRSLGYLGNAYFLPDRDTPPIPEPRDSIYARMPPAPRMPNRELPHCLPLEHLPSLFETHPAKGHSNEDDVQMEMDAFSEQNHDAPLHYFTGILVP